ncbi:MAG: lysophospholipid acyltransferase family protein [Caulobacteraceae bacterium]
MKGLLRSRPVQGAAAFLFAAYIRAALATIRWRREAEDVAETIWDAGGPVVVCFWHSRIGLSPACWPLGRAQAPRALISLSADGAFVAQAMERLGFPAIRGSAGKKSDPAKAKGGSAAFRETLRWLKSGGGIAITPDGPRGPAEIMGEGPPLLARVAGAPVLLVGLAARPCIRLSSWDRGVLPLPFAKGAIVWAGPFEAPANAEAADLKALSAVWQAKLSEVTAAAEAMVA